MGKVKIMKMMAYILATLAAGAIAVTVAINVYTPEPDNKKARELQRRDVEAERKEIENFQRTHPNPFKD